MATGERRSLLQWKRPESGEYPKVWHTFKARDLNSKYLVEYRIQDLPLDRVDDLYEHLLESFLPDEPAGLALGSLNDPHAAEDYKCFWEPIVAQRTPLVCIKGYSNEIIGANMTYIATRGDKYPHSLRKVVSFCFWSMAIFSCSKYRLRLIFSVQRLCCTPNGRVV